MQTIYTSKLIEITDLATRIYAELVGDRNGIHLDEEIARRSRFGRRVAHGMLTAGLISAALAERFPRLIYCGQVLTWLRPVYIGDVVGVELTTDDELVPGRKVQIGTAVWNERGEMVISGYATVLLPPPSEMGAAISPMADVARVMGEAEECRRTDR